GILAHIGITLLLSAFYSLLVTPIIVLLNYLISWKEEKELVIEFGAEYEDYQKRVPMFLPRFRSSDND
ncbi:MAG: methyltransferase family protein, partial [Candidatus Thorarchaeota archaeon]